MHIVTPDSDVVLDDRHVDHQVALEDLGIDRERLEPLAVDGHVAEAAAVEEHDLGASLRATAAAMPLMLVGLGGRCCRGCRPP